MYKTSMALSEIVATQFRSDSPNNKENHFTIYYCSANSAVKRVWQPFLTLTRQTLNDNRPLKTREKKKFVTIFVNK